MRFEAEFGEGGGFDAGGAVGLFFVGAIDDLNVVGFVAGHHLVASDAFEHGVHDGPLRCGFLPAAIGFGFGQFHDFGDADVGLEFAIHDENAAPDDVAGFADAFERATAEAEVHRGLSLGRSTFPAADEVGRRCSAADEQHPDVFRRGRRKSSRSGTLTSSATNKITPAEVVEGVFGGETELAPEFVGHEAVEAGAFIDFVEMRQCFTFKEHALAIGAAHGRAVGVVEHAFDEVAGGCEVFEALLILNADGGAAELVGKAHSGDVHFALKQDLRLGELRGLVCAEFHLQAFFVQPSEHGGSIGIAHFTHRGVECGLTEALFEATSGMQQVIRHDGVEHAHAAFIEDTEDGLLMTKTAREVASGRVVVGGQLQHGKRADVALIMFDRAGAEPLAQAVFEEGVAEVLAPKRGVIHASLGEGSVEVQKTDEAGPLAAPVRHGEDGAAMRGQSSENVVRILPHSLRDDEGRVRIDVAEDLDAHLLRVDEAMLLHAIKRVGAFDRTALGFECDGEFVLHVLLGGPAGLIGGKTEVARGNEVDGLHGWDDIPTLMELLRTAQKLIPLYPWLAVDDL